MTIGLTGQEKGAQGQLPVRQKHINNARALLSSLLDLWAALVNRSAHSPRHTPVPACVLSTRSPPRAQSHRSLWASRTDGTRLWKPRPEPTAGSDRRPERGLLSRAELPSSLWAPFPRTAAATPGLKDRHPLPGKQGGQTHRPDTVKKPDDQLG